MWLKIGYRPSRCCEIFPDSLFNTTKQLSTCSAEMELNPLYHRCFSSIVNSSHYFSIAKNAAILYTYYPSFFIISLCLKTS